MSWVFTPSFCITWAPRPKKRILMPFSSATFLTSFRNQPDVSGPIAKQSSAIQVVLGVDLVAELVAAPEPLPGEELTDLGAERHGGEERQGGVLAGVVAGRGPARLDRALGDRVEALERGDQRARLEELQLERAARHDLDVVGEAGRGRAQVRQLAAEGARHLPLHLALGLGGRCGQGRSEIGRAHQGDGESDDGLERSVSHGDTSAMRVWGATVGCGAGLLLA